METYSRIGILRSYGNKWKLRVVLDYYEDMETYSRIWLLLRYGNLQSYWTTTTLWKLTVVLYYYEAMETYGRIGLLRSYGYLQSYWTSTKLYGTYSRIMPSNSIGTSRKMTITNQGFQKIHSKRVGKISFKSSTTVGRGLKCSSPEKLHSKRVCFGNFERRIWENSPSTKVEEKGTSWCSRQVLSFPLVSSVISHLPHSFRV